MQAAFHPHDDVKLRVVNDLRESNRVKITSLRKISAAGGTVDITEMESVFPGKRTSRHADLSGGHPVIRRL